MNDYDSPQALLDGMETRRGYLYPAHRYLAENAPDFLVAYDQLVGRALLHDGETNAALPVKYRELIVVCLLASMRAPNEAIAGHLRRAMKAGLSRQETLEGFQAAYVPGGAPTLVNGVRALMYLEQASEGQHETERDN